MDSRQKIALFLKQIAEGNAGFELPGWLEKAVKMMYPRLIKWIAHMAPADLDKTMAEIAARFLQVRSDDAPRMMIHTVTEQNDKGQVAVDPSL